MMHLAGHDAGDSAYEHSLAAAEEREGLLGVPHGGAAVDVVDYVGEDLDAVVALDLVEGDGADHALLEGLDDGAGEERRGEHAEQHGAGVHFFHVGGGYGGVAQHDVAAEGVGAVHYFHAVVGVGGVGVAYGGGGVGLHADLPAVGDEAPAGLGGEEQARLVAVVVIGQHADAAAGRARGRGVRTGAGLDFHVSAHGLRYVSYVQK